MYQAFWAGTSQHQHRAWRGERGILLSNPSPTHPATFATTFLLGKPSIWYHIQGLQRFSSHFLPSLWGGGQRQKSTHFAGISEWLRKAVIWPLGQTFLGNVKLLAKTPSFWKVPFWRVLAVSWNHSNQHSGIHKVVYFPRFLPPSPLKTPIVPSHIRYLWVVRWLIELFR